MQKTRCHWLPLDKEDYVAYHDTEWGMPVKDDNALFELLTLEGAQAGLSWYTILKKREGYRKAFKQFDIEKVSEMTDNELHVLVKDESIIRHSGKIKSVRTNALAIKELYNSFPSFYLYLKETLRGIEQVASSEKKVFAEKLSKDLKKRGFAFVGGSIAYSFIQAAGFINDHDTGCFLSENYKQM